MAQHPFVVIIVVIAAAPLARIVRRELEFRLISAQACLPNASTVCYFAPKFVYSFA